MNSSEKQKRLNKVHTLRQFQHDFMLKILKEKMERYNTPKIINYETKTDIYKN